MTLYVKPRPWSASGPSRSPLPVAAPSRLGASQRFPLSFSGARAGREFSNLLSADFLVILHLERK